MTRWFRIYDEILDDPKVQLLSPELFKTWVNLLAIASRNGGKLPTARDMAFSLRVSSEDLKARLDELILIGLIDIQPDQSLEPHNWSKRQWKSDDSADRVRKHRAKKAETATETRRNDSVTVTVTPPDTESDTETERQTVKTREREVDRASEESSNCKQAFNGATEAMLVEIERAMGGHADRKAAESWLATTLSVNGAEPVAQAFAMLATAKAENKPIGHVLRWWSKTAGSLKAKPQPAAVAVRRSEDPYFLAKVTGPRNLKPAPGSDHFPELANA